MDPSTTDTSLEEQLRVEQERVASLKRLLLKEKKLNASLSTVNEQLTTDMTELRNKTTEFGLVWNNIIEQLNNIYPILPQCSDTSPFLTNNNIDDLKSSSASLIDFLIRWGKLLENHAASYREKEQVVHTLTKRLDDISLDLKNESTASLEASKRAADLDAQLNTANEKILFTTQSEAKLKAELDECQLAYSLEKEKTEQLRKVLIEMDLNERNRTDELTACKQEIERLMDALDVLDQKKALNSHLVSETLQSTNVSSSDSNWCKFLVERLRPVWEEADGDPSVPNDVASFMHNCICSLCTEDPTHSATQYEQFVLDLQAIICPDVTLQTSLTRDDLNLILTRVKSLHQMGPQSDPNQHDCSLDRLDDLESSVQDLKSYAREQVDQAELCVMELSNKLDRQSADYDQLIREKEEEIFTLRETSDRLMEDLSTYAKFAHTLMIDFNNYDSANWLQTANLLKPDESNGSLNHEQLVAILDDFVEALHQSYLSNASLTTAIQSKDMELDRLGVSLKLAEDELIDVKNKIKCLSLDLSASQDRESKQADKMQRMKKMLVCLKQDEHKANALQSKVDQLEKESELNREHIKRLKDEKYELEQKVLLLKDQLAQSQVDISDLREEKEVAMDRLSTLQTEFNAYKVKALMTLRSSSNGTQAHSEPSNTNTHQSPPTKHAQPDQSQRLDLMNEQIAQLQKFADESSLKANVAQTECDLLREELSAIKRQYTTLLRDFNEQQHKLKVLMADEHARSQAQSTSSAASIQSDFCSAQLLDKLKVQQQKFCEERASWTEQIDHLTEQNHLLQLQLANIQTMYNNRDPATEKCPHCRGSSTPVSKQEVDVSTLSRLQGDGADNTGSNHRCGTTDEQDHIPWSALSSPNSVELMSHSVHEKQHNDHTRYPILLPLNQLLDTSTNPIARPYNRSWSSQLSTPQSMQHTPTSDKNPSPSSLQISALRGAVQNQQRRVDHLSELLNESEATVIRLEEQAKVLKEEIRRLEKIAYVEKQFTLANPSSPNLKQENDTLGNMASEVVPDEAATRTQYLKSVVLKLLHLSDRGCYEWNQLVTVLSSLLMLDSTETDGLRHNGPNSHVNPDRTNASWSNYLLSWGGIGGS